MAEYKTDRVIDQNANQPIDYSQELRVHRSPIVRYILIGVGWLSVGLGIVGIPLPLLPTTPFLLLAAICFAYSSPRFYSWLMNHRLFGPYIREWREHGSIPLRAKVTAIVLIVVTIGSSIVFLIPLLAVKILLGCIGLGVIVFLLSTPTSKAR
ncbi:MAG: YbaN family protein [bacterium]|nr:YbaN family protein [bacterium]